MLDAGVPVGLGVDGSASNDSSNMLAEVRQALLAHRQGREPERWLTAEDVFWMATRGGARCLGRDDVGSLEPGKAADLVLVDTRRLSYAGAGSDPLAALVFSPWPEPVDTVMVNGRIVVEGGELVGVDVPRLVQQAESASAALLDAALRTSGTDYRRMPGRGTAGPSPVRAFLTDPSARSEVRSSAAQLAHARMPAVGKVVGRSARRSEGPEKLCGVAKYVDDYDLPGSLFGATLRSTIACGRIRSVTLDPAFPWHEYTVATADDIPGANYVALIENDQPLLAKDRVRHLMEPILLVAHPVRAKAYAALAHVRVDYEEEAPILDPELSKTVFKSFHIERGAVDAALAKADVVVEGRLPAAAPGAGLHRDERRRWRGSRRTARS